MQKLQTRFRCFLVCFAMMQVMLSLWSLFIEFLGSYRRCKVASGIIPCVQGPTNIYFKLWVNILTIQMLLCSSGWAWECCCVLHQNVDDHPSIYLGSSCMKWTHEFLGLSNVCLMNFWAILMSYNFCTNIRKLLDKVVFRSALDCVQERE